LFSISLIGIFYFIFLLTGKKKKGGGGGGLQVWDVFLAGHHS
jgi:hypothetical protein